MGELEKLSREYLDGIFSVDHAPKVKHRQPPSSITWKFGKLTVAANTKSEARARLKELGVHLRVGDGALIKVVT